MKVLIIWHYFNNKGVIQNASSMLFEGNCGELNKRISENREENAKKQISNKTYHHISVPHQIVILEQ
jgi:hypothetical protein